MIDSLFSPSGTTRLLGLQFDNGSITKTGAYTVTQTGSLTFPATGGLLNTGYATGWNNSSAYIKVNELATASTNVNKTYCAWYKGTQTATGGGYSPSVPIFGDVTGSVYYGLGISAGKITVANATLNNGTTSVNTGQWVFLAWVVKSNYQVDAYVNGVKELSNISVSNAYPGTSYIGAGYNYAGTEAPTALDSIQIFDGQLTDAQILEIYNATFVTSDSASGGLISEVGEYIVHTFISSGNFVPSKNLIVEYLIVAGGGGSGSGFSGAGGAGGLLTGTTTITAGTYSVIVGAGGGVAANGGNSSALGISTVGGGQGGATNASGSVGGSGGAAGIYDSSSGSLAGAAGTAGQGNAAGASYNGFGDRSTGGGGGSGGVGGNALINHRGGNGGAGTTSTISGASVAYAGGGGGFAYWTNTDYTGVAGYVGSGAAGGGNGGSVAPSLAATSAVTNSGSGGGGGGGSGGSGIVIIRYIQGPVDFDTVVANEGQTVTVTIRGNTATGTRDYTISGVSSADISGASLTGTVTLVDGQATFPIVISEDISTNEGPETLTVSFVENGETLQNSFTILDTSAALLITPSSAVPGETVTVRLNTSNDPQPNGTEIPYTISGIGITAGSMGQPLTGNFVVNNNTAEFTIVVGYVASTTLSVASFGTTANCAITFTANITDIVVQSDYTDTEVETATFSVLPFSAVPITLNTATNVETGFVQITTVNYVNYAEPTTVTDTVENGGASNMYAVVPLGQPLVREYWI